MNKLEIFKKKLVYRSNYRGTKEMDILLSGFVKKYIKTNSKIIEIGSNDGTFLKNFDNQSSQIIGFEPSKNVADVSKKNGIPTLNCFFATFFLRSLNLRIFAMLAPTTMILPTTNSVTTRVKSPSPV